MNTFDINKFAQEVHANAVEKGWWNPAPDFATFIALCHAELSEALEEYRNGRPMVYYWCEGSELNNEGCWCEHPDTADCVSLPQKEACEYRSAKPEGIAVELADCVIRMLDWCAAKGVDITATDDWWSGRLIKLAGFELPKLIAELHFAIGDVYENENCTSSYPEIIRAIQTWLAARDIDLWEVARLKHEYNKTRSYRHGNKKC